MPSANYQLFRKAIIGRKQITCIYEDSYREICPLILGHKNGQEVALSYQLKGPERVSRPVKGWRCLRLESVREATLRDGPWDEGASHKTTQTCVDEVDVDVNKPETLRRRRPAPAAGSSSTVQRRKK